MITFLDGPAQGVTLMLRRAPLALRVVRGPKGWDALDQLDDRPAAGEFVYVYVARHKPTSMHLLIRGKGRRDGGWYQSCQYAHWPNPPPEDALRDNDAWRAWVMAHKDELSASLPTEQRAGLHDPLATSSADD